MAYIIPFYKAEYGSSKLFAEVAFGIAIDNNLLENTNHLDTTSILVHESYEVNDDPKTIEVTHGFSKDHRSDLKQLVLSLLVNNGNDAEEAVIQSIEKTGQNVLQEWANRKEKQARQVTNLENCRPHEKKCRMAHKHLTLFLLKSGVF